MKASVEGAGGCRVSGVAVDLVSGGVGDGGTAGVRGDMDDDDAVLVLSSLSLMACLNTKHKLRESPGVNYARHLGKLTSAPLSINSLATCSEPPAAAACNADIPSQTASTGWPSDKAY